MVSRIQSLETWWWNRIAEKGEKREKKTVDWECWNYFVVFGGCNTMRIASFADAIKEKLSVVKSTGFYSLADLTLSV